MDNRYYDAKSVLEQWKVDNKAKVKRYFVEHAWLRADVEKALRYAASNRLCILAITATTVYGIDIYGMTHIAGRGVLEIQDNYQ